MNGSCLCGAHRFSYDGPAGEITACHCQQCRRLSGHFAASFDVDPQRVTWVSSQPSGRYFGAKGSVRGFCRSCGSKLWFRDAEGTMSIEAGIVDGPTGGRLTQHIHTDELPDYYDCVDGCPRAKERSME